jgi:tRNA(adenine34) deaminase
MTTRMTDLDYMKLALDVAARALSTGDVPIGAVAVRAGEIIGTGCNRREADQDPTAHAEMIAIRQAAAALGKWRLDGVTLYCTLEPCAMCAGALVLARLPRLVYAAPDAKAGAAGSVLDVARHPALNHRLDVSAGLCADEAAALLQTFFQSLRQPK